MKLPLLALLLFCSCRDDAKDSGVETDTPPVDTQVEDADGDGFSADLDCDDGDPDVNPGVVEVCDGLDNDCDGLVDDADDPVGNKAIWYQDLDGDGFGNPGSILEACEQPVGYVSDQTDCNDLDPHFHPGAEETDCTDENDYNCDGSVGFADEDGDGFAACEDCDDATSTSNPLAFEVCDGADNDCDGATDEEDAVDGEAWYADTDSDGYGDAAVQVSACEAPSGFVADDTDCDDTNALVNESAVESCDGTDNDCDGWVDDDDPDVTGTTTWYGDSDGDGYGGDQYQQEACVSPAGFVSTNDDCDDLDPASHPGASEVCDDADNDCDGTVDEGVGSTWYQDSDGDGYGNGSVSQESCEPGAGYVSNALDCDDFAASSSPASFEICDGADNDCDGAVDENDAINAQTWYADADGDGYGTSASSQAACVVPAQHVSNDNDCDDTAASIHPGAPEVCDGTDNNCDGVSDGAGSTDALTWYADTDGDGFGDAASTTLACTQPANFVADASDCDDTDAGAASTAVDGDCDGVLTADDCDDSNATSTTLATDGDCDGTLTAEDCDDSNAASTILATDADCDGVLAASDCDETDAARNACASCLEWYSYSNQGDGIYTIDPESDGTGFDAYCDMTTDGGGWTLAASVVTQGGIWTNGGYNTGNSARATTLGSPSPTQDYVLQIGHWQKLLENSGTSSMLRLTVRRIDNGADVALGFLEGLQMNSNGNFTNPTATYSGNMTAIGTTSSCVIQYSSDFQSVVVNAAFDSSDHACTGAIGWNGSCGYPSLGHEGSYEGRGGGDFSHACSLDNTYYCSSDNMTGGGGDYCFFARKWYWLR